MNKFIKWVANPPVGNQGSILILRLMAGGVFFWEGVLKFVFPNLGVGRFTKLGFPAPVFTADFVAVLEIVGGLCLILGLLTRFFSLLFVIEMIVAILTTKISIFLGTSPLGMPPSPPKTGLGALLHEIRPDYAQLLVSLFLLLEGSDRWSLDNFFRIQKNRLVQ